MDDTPLDQQPEVLFPDKDEDLPYSRPQIRHTQRQELHAM